MTRNAIGVGVLACSLVHVACSGTPPHVVQFSAVPPVVHPNESLELIALVDTNYKSGSVRLGGIVKDDSGRVYGSLKDPGYSSSLSVEIPWSIVDEVAPLSFLGRDTVERTFIAEFDENDLHDRFHSSAIVVRFQCKATDDSRRFGLCDHRCVDLATADHCGNCATSCSAGEACRAGKCLPA